MAATNKLSVILPLLVIAATLVALQPENVAGKVCPQLCLGAEYMTCGSSDERLNPSCNCCLAPQGCTLYFSDGTSQYCA
ncbi:Proteinase inhibitor I [Trema orientale]|uniref:Proteinase inhibitor I n=1 Tax=Trema orientale TaxID=63057 RepID=A0A2P5EHN1_TREOI|nr:Proteinase inhibitor I [Trema orientale]